MLYALMQECRNYFPVPGAAMIGTFTIENGVIGGLDLPVGQYYIVDGSVFSDGLHKAPELLQADETFTGKIIPLRVPQAFVDYAEQLKAEEEKAGNTNDVSESFNGYSVTRATGSDGHILTVLERHRAEYMARWGKI